MEELKPKKQMVFFAIWSRSHSLDLQPNMLLFLELGCLFEIYSSIEIIFQNYM